MTAGFSPWRFIFACLSNNHLLSSEKWIDGAIMNARRGGQVYFKGYVADYSHSGNSFVRKTSTARDTNCEIVFVTDFKIIKKANVLWRFLFEVSKIFISACLVIMSFFYLKKRPTSGLIFYPGQLLYLK